MTPSAIVTGGNGFIGTHLIRQLCREGWDVTAVIRAGRALAPDLRDGVRVVHADMAEYARLDELTGPCEQAVVFHLAWDGLCGPVLQDHATQLANASHSADAVAAAARMGCARFVMVGSMNEYEILGLGERSGVRLRWANNYAASKLAAEHIGKTVASQVGIEFVTARLAMAYGPGNYSPMLPNVVLSQLISGQTPRLVEGRGEYDMVYVEEIVGALIAVAERGVDQRMYYVGHEQSRTFRQILEALRDAVAPGAELDFGAYPEENSIDYSLVDRSLLRVDTGYVCDADFAASVCTTADWLAATPGARP